VTRRLKRSIGELHHGPSVRGRGLGSTAAGRQGHATGSSGAPAHARHWQPLSSPSPTLPPAHPPAHHRQAEAHHDHAHASAAEKEHAERNRVKNIQVGVGGEGVRGAGWRGRPAALSAEGVR
jgi:hypothetical protein